ncbi:MAG TPA: nuclear transport factor 2 family protein [Parafilimonas sp.]|jgi:ketosteroid isomerase-like protein
MKTGLLLLSQLLVISLCSTIIFSACSNDVSKEVIAVHARSKAVTAAEEAQNIPEIMKYWAKDAIVQPAGMPQIQGTEAIIKLYHQIFDDTAMKLNSFTSSSINSPNITVAQSGDIAYDYGTNKFVWNTANGDMTDMGKYLIVWKKINSDWFVSAISFTSDAPPPAH